MSDTHSANPWLEFAPVAAASAAEATLVSTRGSSVWRNGVPHRPSYVGGIPARLLDLVAVADARLWLVSLTQTPVVASKLAGLLNAEYLDRAWPGLSDAAPRVLLVGAATGDGVEALSCASHQWAVGAAGGVDLLGAVVCVPGKTLPREIDLRLRVTAGGVPRTWLLTQVKTWRGTSVPPNVGALINDLDVLLDERR